VEAGGRKGAGELEALAPDEPHVGPDLGGEIADVRGPALPALDVADEVAAIAGHVEDAGVARHVPLEVPGDLRPDRLLGRDVEIREAAPVEAAQRVEAAR